MDKKEVEKFWILIIKIEDILVDPSEKNVRKMISKEIKI